MSLRSNRLYSSAAIPTKPLAADSLRASSFYDSLTGDVYCQIMKGNRHFGFTLIELSIVLVIIGLVVGGILVGREMIRASELRKVISDSERFVTAANAFKGKYNCLPGDCANATSYFTGAVNGNGDGVIRYGPGSTSETFNYWSHLNQAGLIAGTYTANSNGHLFTLDEMPNGPIGNSSYYIVEAPYYWNTMGDGTVYNAASWGLIVVPASTRPTNSNWLLFGNFRANFSVETQPVMSPADAKSIDSKIDDGTPFKGQIGAGDAVGTFIPMPGGIVDVTFATAAYGTSTSSISCILMRKMP